MSRWFARWRRRPEPMTGYATPMGGVLAWSAPPEPPALTAAIDATDIGVIERLADEGVGALRGMGAGSFVNVRAIQGLVRTLHGRLGEFAGDEPPETIPLRQAEVDIVAKFVAALRDHGPGRYNGRHPACAEAGVMLMRRLDVALGMARARCELGDSGAG